MFQSTPPRGRRRWEIRGGVGIAGFNPRLRVGGDLSGETHGPRTAGFNPRLRVGGDLTSVPGLTPEQQFQSTPPRGRRPAQQAVNGLSSVLFQSTPPRGRRPSAWWAVTSPKRFQSTPPRGRRPQNGDVHRHGFQVSIHASAWEATHRRMREILLQEFQSTPPRGRRPSLSSTSSTHLRFQSTPPRGRRLPPLLVDTGIAGFNPRLRVGGDLFVLQRRWPHAVSIHASAWEATSRVFNAKWRIDVSIHASAWEATLAMAFSSTGVMFQSTPPRGRRHER